MSSFSSTRAPSLFRRLSGGHRVTSIGERFFQPRDNGLEHFHARPAAIGCFHDGPWRPLSLRALEHLLHCEGVVLVIPVLPPVLLLYQQLAQRLLTNALESLGLFFSADMKKELDDDAAIVRQR